MELINAVDRINATVREVMLAHVGASLIGLIVQGSAVKGGFISGSSDIDYILYVEDAALNEAKTLPAERCIAIHLALSEIDVRPFRYIQFSVASPSTHAYLGPVPGTYRLLAGRLMVPEATGAELYADAVRSLESLIPDEAFNPHQLLDHGEDRIERCARLMCTKVWPLAFQLLTVIHRDGLRIWRMNKQDAVAWLCQVPGAADEIAAFDRAVRSYYPKEQSAAGALALIQAGVAFIHAVKRTWTSMNKRKSSPKLILVEGIPGSGKSTTAQNISLHFRHEGVPHRWWYEEQQDHPVYMYRDYDSMKPIVSKLNNGQYAEVIALALEHWRKFAAAVQASDEIVIADGCLFGYLSWSLFPCNVEKCEILQYIQEVGDIIAPLNPQLVYFYPSDIEAALRRICDRRGGDTESNWIRSTTGSTYGEMRNLNGFEGMAAYWQDYRELTDEAFQAWTGSKIAIENSEGNWPRYREEIRIFLGLGPLDDECVIMQNLDEFTGCYVSNKEGEADCTVELRGGNLVVDGLPHAWRSSPLIPVESNTFHVQSLPLQVRFEGEELHLTGPDLLDGPVDYRFTKKVTEE